MNISPISIIFFVGFVCLWISHYVWKSSKRGPFPKKDVAYIIKRSKEE